MRRFYAYLQEIVSTKLRNIHLIEVIGGRVQQAGQEAQFVPPVRFNLEGLFKLIRLLLRTCGHLAAISFYLLDDVVLLSQLNLIPPNILGIESLRWINLRNFMALYKNLLHLANSIMVMDSIACSQKALRDKLKQLGGSQEVSKMRKLKKQEHSMSLLDLQQEFELERPLTPRESAVKAHEQCTDETHQL